MTSCVVNEVLEKDPQHHAGVLILAFLQDHFHHIQLDIVSVIDSKLDDPLLEVRDSHAKSKLSDDLVNFFWIASEDQL